MKDAFDAYYKAAHDTLEKLFQDNFGRLRTIEDKEATDRTAEEWTLMETIPEMLQYIEHLQDRIQDNKRKVMAWRNQARRARSG